ncbi:hypothetical protein [Sporomusa aerivorans]|uniref:hypothetical protein n=1 Tax=Sporomusa aerivorans TaxID=204936 RepID=UPI00352A95FC
MFWYLSILTMVVVGLGLIVGIWLKLLEDEQGSKILGLYAVAICFLLLVTTMLSYRLFLSR